MRLALLALCCSLAGMACSANDGSSGGAATTATPSGTPTSTRPGAFVSPPSAYLKDSSGTPVEGFTGTFCWQQGQGGMCADYSPWGTNKTAIALRAGQSLEFVFDAGLPRDAKVRWLRVDSVTPRDLGGALDWTPTDPKLEPLVADLKAPTTAARYALEVFTLFPQGDVTYGFYVEVR